MSAPATEAKILAGVERWAEAAGRGQDEWFVDTETGRVVIVHGPSRQSWTVSPALALAWALTVEADPEPVDVGRCPACRSTRVQFNSNGPWPSEDAAREAVRHIIDSGIDVALDHDPSGPGRGWYATYAVDCPACSGTGRETVPLARLLLDATRCSCNTNPETTDGPDIECPKHGIADGPVAQMLLVHADKMQAAGHPLGEVLSLALGPWSKPARDDLHCPGCNMPARECLAQSACWLHDLEPRPRGTGEALRWLEWLTWAREFARERVADEVHE